MCITYLNGVTVTSLAKYLEQCWVRHEEETGKHQSFALQISAYTFHIVFTALHEMQTRCSDENSVRPSVCPSVCPSVRPSHA